MNSNLIKTLVEFLVLWIPITIILLIAGSAANSLTWITNWSELSKEVISIFWAISSIVAFITVMARSEIFND